MLGDNNPAVSPNGHSTANSNGAPASRAPTVSNGTRKAPVSMNGSSNGDKGTSNTVQRSSTYFGHSREEVSRLLIQALTDLGYSNAADSVSRDSGYALESPTVTSFRKAVISGAWSDAEELLLGAAEAHGGEGNGLVLDKAANRDLMRFWIRQQKYLELLEQRDTAKALGVLRSELTPLYNDTSKLHFLSSLLMAPTPEHVKQQARWDGAGGRSRQVLLLDLSRCISPSVMLPENRLAVLLHAVKKTQINTCLYHTEVMSPSLYADHSCPRERFPTEVALELTELQGEVWQIQYSPDGSMLAGCGRSSTVVVWDNEHTVLAELDGHEGGVGNLAWSPDSNYLVTCAQDKIARLWRVGTSECVKKSKRFGEPVSSCVWAQDGQSFILGTLDNKHGICTYTLDGWEMIEWGKKHRVQDLCGSPDGRRLVAVDDHCMMHVYSIPTRTLEYRLELKARPTSVSISEDSKHLLVNKQDGEAQLINLDTRESIHKFLGHTGGDYLIRSSFGGANESFVTSGSEDGNILIWHKTIGAAVERLHGHTPRCNAVSWKPDDPTILASCGDDGKVKIWSNPVKARQIRESARDNFLGIGA